MGRRRTGRELALQLAYWLDQKGLSEAELEGALGSLPLLDDESTFEKLGGEAEAAPDAQTYLSDQDWEKAKEFALALVRGTWRNLGEVDSQIVRLTQHWRPERMPQVDRNILRLACYELLHAGDIPPKATINEWIEVAKKYSTENSGAFVNGILDRLYKEHAPEVPAGPGLAGSPHPKRGAS